MRPFVSALAFAAPLMLVAQCDRWQQRITCDLDVELDVRTHRFTGKEKLVYKNNSPDTLRTLFFHLYFNAFRPGSEMDVRSRTIKDPDERVGGRIAELTPDQMGELLCADMLQDGKPVTLEHIGTVLKVKLARPILPGKTSTLSFGFNGQVPVQIRRSGRDNAEGISYSMTQWYPKVAAYDHQGWHADPYVGREFYGEWGDFHVSLTLDSSFTVAATGLLKNAAEIGHGYAARTKVQKGMGGRTKWLFEARNVHDFAWAADPDYKHITAQVPEGPLLHFFYEDKPELETTWKELPAYMVKSFQFMAAHFGAYPYPQFTFAQGGDGGMEYPNLTLLTGKRRLGSLVGTSVHESVHNWYYGMLGSDEASFPWMDEGFTEYASSEVMQRLFDTKGDPHLDAYKGYYALADRGEVHEPMSTHADHFTTNFGYGATAYSKGEMFLHQLAPVIGDRNVHEGLLRYYAACRFKHPEPIDVQRVMEKQSGLQLDWYFDEWINTTRKLDHAVTGVLERNDSTFITLANKGAMLMPVDLEVELRDGTRTTYHIPLSLMLGSKPEGSEAFTFTVLSPWLWTHPTYTFALPVPMKRVAAIRLDPTQRVADMDRSNDELVLPEGMEGVLQR